jgi:exo-1,4-beta-D-glucosaminidase
MRSIALSLGLCLLLLSSAAGSAAAHDRHDAAGASELTRGWSIQSSAVATQPGGVVSRPGYSTRGWLPISEPETLMAGLVENGRYPDVLRSDALAKVPTAQFDVNWWYRNEVRLHPRRGQHVFLTMNGVLSRANLWVNGVKVADQSQLQGAYSRLEYDITDQVRDGANAIALDVYKNDSSEAGYLTMNMVDWNPPSPDGWTGLQFAPTIATDGAISLRDAHVTQSDAADLSSADLTLKAVVRNNTSSPQTAVVDGRIAGHGTHAVRATTVVVPAGASKAVSLPVVHVDHPAVWWPYQMGDQPLYHFSMSATGRDRGADAGAASGDFGIRTVTSTLTKPVPGVTLQPDGYRQFAINGRPFVVRGGGWSQDMFLRYSPQNIADQLATIKNLGLNTIRFEGNYPPDDIFAQMDRAGLLAMPGWQCCNKWEQDASQWSDEIKASAANQAGAVARRLRSHPSVFTYFQGSDNEPDPVKEDIFLKAFAAADWETPQVAAAENKASAQLGISGAKEGPYNYAPPTYWWNNTQDMNIGDDFTNAGGAFGFDTESGSGNTIPTQDSLNRFLTPAEQAQLWDLSSTGGRGTGPDIFHTSEYNDYTEIGRLGQYNTPLARRYGPWTDLASYERVAQAGGYEVTRAQFEAYIGHAKDPANPSTGLIYWQMNKAWPSLQWELYGYDFDQSGVTFGAKKANEPVHIMYAYDDRSIKVSNLTGATQRGLHARVDVLDLDGSVKGSAQADVGSLDPQDVRTVLQTPAVAAAALSSPTYFVRLVLTRGDQTVSRNVYWLSTKPDTVDYDRTLGEGFGAVFAGDGYADLTGLAGLPQAAVTAQARSRNDHGDVVTTVTLRNDSATPTPAVLLRADVRRGGRDGRPLGGDDQVLPIAWSDDDVTLWPGEEQTITARFRRADLRGARPVVTVAGFNADRQVVGAG